MKEGQGEAGDGSRERREEMQRDGGTGRRNRESRDGSREPGVGIGGWVSGVRSLGSWVMSNFFAKIYNF